MSEFHGRMARPGEAQALRDDIQPGSGEGGSMSGGHVVVPDQFIDRTAGRVSTRTSSTSVSPGIW